jgi:predicted alpha/beta hydrolase
VTTIRSRAIRLPDDPAAFGNLTFRYYLAHDARATTADYLRVMVEADDGARTVVFEERGGPEDDDAVWARASVSLADWAGRSIRLVVAARDGGGGNLVEAALDDIRIRQP